MKAYKYFTLAVLSLTFSIIIQNHSPYQQTAFAETRNNVVLPEVKSFVLPNKIRAFYIKDELPQFTITVSIGFGKLHETRDNAGISSLLAKTLSLGGSKKYPAQVLHQKIESIGGRIRISSSWEETFISIRVLKRHADFAFDIISDILLNPNLDTNYIEQARSLLLENVKRKQDNPDMLAFEKLREIIFNGDGYGSVTREVTLKSITRDDLLKVWDDYFNAGNTILGISSSLNLEDIKKNKQNRLSDIKKGREKNYSIDYNKLTTSMKKNSKRVYLIPKDIPQATIALGTIAPTIKDTRIYSLKMMNYILGGGSFNSRLMKEIRVKRGLSYSVQSVIRFRKNTGVFIAYAQTRNETADTALSLLLENINIMAKDPVLDDELQWTKESIKNSYIFEFDTPLSILSKYTFLSYNGLTKSYLENYLKNIESVKKKQIQTSGKELFNSGLIKVIVGKIELKEKLKKFGNVVIVEK